jgi:type II secretory pathway component PulF
MVRGGGAAAAIGALAVRYPSRLIRSRLRSVAGEVEQGGDWIASFRRGRLISRTDVALLRAATKAGNLAWALEEAAAAAQRRLAYRLQTIGQILMPLAILLAGGCVMLFAVGGILPLVSLISELAKK